MKFDHFNRKNTTYAIYACLVVTFAVTLVFAFVHIGTLAAAGGKLLDVLSPVIYGVILAYLINPIYKVIYNKAFYAVGAKKGKTRLRCALSLALTYIFVFCMIFLFFLILVPQLEESYFSLVSQITTLVSDASVWVNELMSAGGIAEWLFGKLLSDFSASEISSTLQKVLTESYDMVSTVTPYLLSLVSGFVIAAKNWIIGLIISVYLLASKETLCAQIEKIVIALLKKDRAKKTQEFLYYVDHTFGRFLLGKILDSIIIGIFTFILMSIFGIPYTPLISVIVGVTNVIPFFGPFIGAIPSIFIVLIADPLKALWCALLILIIQQIDGNIIGPKIIGDTTGISSLWIVISIIVFGGLFGLVGMIIAVPLFSIIYKLIKDAVERRLSEQGLPTDTNDYVGKRGAGEEGKDTEKKK